MRVNIRVSELIKEFVVVNGWDVGSESDFIRDVVLEVSSNISPDSLVDDIKDIFQTISTNKNNKSSLTKNIAMSVTKEELDDITKAAHTMSDASISEFIRACLIMELNNPNSQYITDIDINKYKRQ